MRKAQVLFIWLLVQCMACTLYARGDAAVSEPVKKILLRSVTFGGNKITKAAIIAREMNIHAGDSLVVQDVEYLLEFNKRRILNLQLFSRVEYCIDAWDDTGIDVVYEVNEILYWLPAPIFSLADRNFNVWWIEEGRRLDRTNIGFELTRINFRGRDERINILVQLGYNKLFNLSYRIPYIDKRLRYGFNAGLTYATGREINYETDSNKLLFYANEHYPYRRLQARVGTSYRKAYVAVHDLQLSYNHFGISEELQQKNNDYLGGTLRADYLEWMYNYQFNNTDARVYPTKGMEIRANAVYRGFSFTAGDINQLAVMGDASWYKPLSRLFSVALAGRARFSVGAQQPYFMNRAMGFRADYLRGYEYYVIDGSHFAMGRTNVRMRIIDRVITQRIVPLMTYIPFRVYVKSFHDIGYVYNKFPGNSYLNNRLLNGYGVGVDIVVSYYARFRIEYSFNHLGEKGLFLHGSKE